MHVTLRCKANNIEHATLGLSKLPFFLLVNIYHNVLYKHPKKEGGKTNKRCPKGWKIEGKIELTAWCGKLESAEANVIQSFIVQYHTLVCIFNKLVNRECGIVRFNNSVRHLWRREHRESEHHSVWVFFSDLRNQKGSHSWTSSTTQWVANLKPWRSFRKHVSSCGFGNTAMQ